MKTPQQYAEDLNFGNENIWNAEGLTREMARSVLEEAMAEARAEALEEAAKAVEKEESDGDDDIEGPVYSSGWRDATRRYASLLRNMKRPVDVTKQSDS